MAVKNAAAYSIDRLTALNQNFLVGRRVQVKRCCEDFYCFNGTETGEVVENNGGYLGIIVKFDQSKWIQGTFGKPWEMKQFNFNGHNLVLLESGEPTAYVPGLSEVWDA